MAVPAAFARVMRVLQLYANVPASEVKALAQELDDIPGEGGAHVTLEDFSIPVDYNAVGAIDPPAGVVLAGADDVAAALGTAPAFKHLEAVYAALPREIQHVVTINLAAGIHRPWTSSPGFASWNLESKRITVGGTLVLQGAAPSLYAPRPGLTFPIAITGIQAASGDPWIDVSGTPFTGLNLKGSWAVLNTGQAVLIHDHTASRLSVMEAISPVPTSITLIGRPSTILRNSITDTIRFKTSSVSSGTLDNDNGTFQVIDVALDPFGGSSIAWAHSGFMWAVRHLLDQDSALDNAPVIAPDGNGWIWADALMQSCAFINRQTTGGADQLLTITTGGANIWNSYFENSEDACDFRGAGVFNVVRNVVFNSVGRNIGAGSRSLQVAAPGRLDMLDLPTFGKQNEFRNGKAGVPSLLLKNGAFTRDSFQTCIFKNNLAAAVRLEAGAQLDLSASGSLGYKDGGGNSDVGIDIVGPGAVANLNTGTNVTGTAGDVRLGGVVQTYASIPSTGSGNANIASAARRA